MTFPKKFVIPVVVVLVLVGLSLAAWLFSNAKAKGLSIVYLSSQEIYVGHLHTFPKLMLTDGYILQNTANGKTSDLQLVPLSGKAWAPTRIYINREQVLYYGPLSTTSEAYKGLKK